MREAVVVLLEASPSGQSAAWLTDWAEREADRRAWLGQGLDLMRRLQLERRDVRLVVGSSFDPPDPMVMASVAEYLNVELFRGSYDSLLDRAYNAALAFSASHVLLLPFAVGVDALTTAHLLKLLAQAEMSAQDAEGPVDLLVDEATGVHVLRFIALETAFWDAGLELPHWQQTATGWMLDHPDQFRIHRVSEPV